MTKPAAAYGFTLLEVMVSMAILAVSLVAVLNMHSGGVRMHNRAKFLTVASVLARSKMVDVEEHLLAEGFSEFDDTLDGDFEEEGYAAFTWKAEVVKPDLDVSTSDLVGVITKAMGVDPEAMGDDPAMGQLQGFAGPMIEQMIPRLEEGVREVRLTVAWQDATGPSDLTVVTHVVRLPEQQGAPGSANDVQTQQAGQIQQQIQNRLMQGGSSLPNFNRPGGGRVIPNLRQGPRMLPALGGGGEEK